jgi:hypothetical protein
MIADLSDDRGPELSSIHLKSRTAIEPFDRAMLTSSLIFINELNGQIDFKNLQILSA